MNAADSLLNDLNALHPTYPDGARANLAARDAMRAAHDAADAAYAQACRDATATFDVARAAYHAACDAMRDVCSAWEAAILRGDDDAARAAYQAARARYAVACSARVDAGFAHDTAHDAAWSAYLKSCNDARATYGATCEPPIGAL